MRRQQSDSQLIKIVVDHFAEVGEHRLEVVVHGEVPAGQAIRSAGGQPDDQLCYGGQPFRQ
jgi:hypothetical protein